MSTSKFGFDMMVIIRDDNFPPLRLARILELYPGKDKMKVVTIRIVDETIKR